MSLANSPSEISSTRRAVARRLTEWGLDRLAEDVVLVINELLANVHEHAGGDGELTIELTNDRLTVKVGDNNRTPPALREQRSSAESGRGLLLVDMLTDHWETVITGAGKVVICTFRIGEKG
ncbi:ATP-binding protein [Streptomyces jumonjinensis]|uniref:ATP-binding protein n=1 Tax=Streptomyces jumonjinensis TaxID=1945 RepID=UPI0037AC663D